MKIKLFLYILTISIFWSCSDGVGTKDTNGNLSDIKVILDTTDYDTGDISILPDDNDLPDGNVFPDDMEDISVSDTLSDTSETNDASDIKIIEPRVVFKRADDKVKMGENLLKNPDFENTDMSNILDWKPYQSGYKIDSGRTGKAVLLERTENDTNQYGIYQSVILNQKTKKSIFFSGWSKSENLSGNPDSAASIYLDIKYVTIDEDPVNGCDPATSSPCSLYGQIPDPRFDTGTHDWQRRYGFATPLYPIKSVSFYLLLRGDHYGKLWFDDVEMREVDQEIVVFDSTKVAVMEPTGEYRSNSEQTIEAEDSLILSFYENGGVIKGLYANGENLAGNSRDYTSGIIFHEIQSDEWISTGGLLERDGNKYNLSTNLTEYELSLDAEFVSKKDRIDAKINMESLKNINRSFTVYFAIPLDIENGLWGRDIRREVSVELAAEHSETVTFWYDRLGYTGRFSSYPIGSIYNKHIGVVLGVPPESTRIFRIVYNKALKILFIAFDLSLSPDTVKFPNRADLEFVIYKIEPDEMNLGFRYAIDGFYKRFPDAFKRRIPPEREGIWVAFADLSKVINEEGQSIKDFNIGIHEIGSLKHTEFDDANDILSFRYIIEPASTWLRITDDTVNPEDYDSVMNYLNKLYTTGTDKEKRTAEKTLSSGVFDSSQRYVFKPYLSGPPWCSGKCALFYLNPDPDIDVPPYTINQAKYFVNETAMSAYNSYPGLDGEYVDSFVMWGTYINQRKEHFSATDTPLTFKAGSPDIIGIPVIFSTIEFTKWLREQIPSGKYLIANGVLAGKVMWGYNLFDFMGQEIKWVKETTNGFELVPESDEYLSYRRTLSYQRPYGFLMNVDFNTMSFEMVEKYMKVCLFYGIYPSMFSHNASEDNYFSLPQFYQRDRELFKKYIPLIREINTAGWTPITNAYTNDKDIYIERFGNINNSLFFTIRNISDSPKTILLKIDRNKLNLSGELVIKHLISSEKEKNISADIDEVEISIGSQDVDLIKIEAN